ncbi:alkaline phosphatase family protein [Thalassotalea sp. LPB0316]|uniref:alkaline phosphatase D family protein n=1 Tax=Thalassotalea sp. LPB0316 TaxID=2769490 RepID=UPI00186805F1|nr:alkaline phosphatase D family protein [Thalassotalea sp. LPB0316]QOL24346.1 alkaline phosphatase family protein [Thalassotalea sp. LPB0316]
MLRIFVLITLLASPLSLFAAPVEKIYFGSCAKQHKPLPIFDAINQDKPDVFVFLGDNVYSSYFDISQMPKQYQQLGGHKGFKKLRAQSEVIAIWDDHDYGQGDGGKYFKDKEKSRKYMLDFWREPKDSPRYHQDGIYTSYLYGEGEQTIRVILPDLRWNRDNLYSVDKATYETERQPKFMGPYIPSTNPSDQLLGDTQWQWLEAELKKPATIKIIGSGIQLLNEFSGWETWANFPHERKRLLEFIAKEKISGVLFISGDTHFGDISKVSKDLPYALWEITSSGLSEKWKEVSPNKHRIGKGVNVVNYGFIEVDWQQADPVIDMGLKGKDGNVIKHFSLRLSQLSADQKT